jgi:hypothetical protein
VWTFTASGEKNLVEPYIEGFVKFNRCVELSDAQETLGFPVV